MEPIPVFKEKKAISPVWTLPIIALIICAWIVYTSYKNAGIPITVYFEDATGITAGKTQVIARGVPIGTVKKIVPDVGNRRVKASVTIDKSAADMLVEDTLFWIVRPEISAASVEGLDTLFSGSYIGIQPGTSATNAEEFIGVEAAPPIPKETPGLHVVLRAEKLGSIQNGSSVYYRNVAIGSVTSHSLDQANDTITIKIYIQPEYSHLVKEGSRFCNASGVTIQGKLTNLKVQVESLASLIRGGIVLHTPEQLSDTPPVDNGHVFLLYKDVDAARYGIKMTLQLASSKGITEGETQVIYRGLVAGVVEKIEFSNDERRSVTAHIMLDPRAERILRETTQFWMVTPEISPERIENIDLLLAGSFITFDPGTGAFQDQFTILPEPPPQKPLRAGTEFILSAEDSYALQRGAPVMFKSKKVGEVLDIEIDESLSHFSIPVYIYRPYERLIRADSVFWRDGGVSMEASLQGVEVQANSLAAILRGGISFLTPENSQKNPVTEIAGTIFPVYGSYEEARQKSKALQEPGFRFQLITDDPKAYRAGTPIFYKNINVGEVSGLRLSKNNLHVLLDCFIREIYADTVNSSSRFYDLSGITVAGSLSGVSMETGSLRSILEGGLSYFTPKKEAGKSDKPTFPLYASRDKAEAVDKAAIIVKFSDCDDLKEGAPVKYKGVVIGEVAKLRFADNLRDIMVTLLIDRQAATFFKEDTKIWLEQTEISLSGIKNMKNVLFGSYISILPGPGPLKRTFVAQSSPPIKQVEKLTGLQLTLQTKNLGSLKIDSPVYYRQIQVGKVTSFRLSETYESVLIFINIEEPYVPIVRENTRFWKASGARISGGLFSGLSISTESMEALLTGGIALATPENAEMGKPVAAYHLFTLHNQAEEEWRDWQPNITLVKKEIPKSVPTARKAE
ncbi:MAG: MlaD family protein [Desulfocapsaceae bacterium]|nr:MlaD family protein [Desulfocapsaceae bacterium]